MFTTYLRSSSYNCSNLCEQQYLLSYVLGFKTKSGRAAEKGNCIHKFLEYLALCKIAIQEGKNEIELDGIEIDLSNIPYDDLINKGFDYYAQNNPLLTIKERRECGRWAQKVLDYQNGRFNPLKSEIIAAEKSFDIPIKKEWAKYDLNIGPNNYKGYFSIKGNVDIITKYSDKVYHLIDYKTGKRINWGKGEAIKSFKDFEDDPQLKIYYYALAHMFPDKEILITIYWINDGNEFTLPFDRSQLPSIEKMLRDKYEEICKIDRPKLLSWNRTDWRCKVLCKHGKNEYKNGKSTCEYIRDEIQLKGLTKTLEEHVQCDPTVYRDGGGAKELKEKDLKG